MVVQILPKSGAAVSAHQSAQNQDPGHTGRRLAERWSAGVALQAGDLGPVAAGAGGDQWPAFCRWIAAVAAAAGGVKPRASASLLAGSDCRGLEALFAAVAAAEATAVAIGHPCQRSNDGLSTNVRHMHWCASMSQHFERVNVLGEDETCWQT